MQWLKRHLPRPEEILASRWMRWFPAWLHHPRLWHWSRRGVALGVALGLFFGLLLPTAQIPFSAVAAAAIRANLPAAAAGTLVSNPVTTPPIYFGAYKVGHWLLGGEENIPIHKVDPSGGGADDLQAWIARIGPPLFLGLAVIAVLVSVAGYMLVSLAWAMGVLIKRRKGRPTV